MSNDNNSLNDMWNEGLTEAYPPARPPITVALNSTSYQLRMFYTHRRRHYMEGGWPLIARLSVAATLSAEALQDFRSPDFTHNTYRDVISRISTRYLETPLVTGPIGDLDAETLFASHVDVEQMAMAYNSCLLDMRIVDGELVTQALPPDHCDAVVEDGRIVWLRMARPTVVIRSYGEYILEEWDIRDQANPLFRTFGSEGWIDSHEYPWVYSDGRPFIPAVVYRASKPADYWGANRWPELIDMTNEDCVHWTIYKYSSLNAGSGMPYSIDCSIMGQASGDDDLGASNISMGSMSLSQFKSDGNKAGSVGLIQPAFDAEKAVEALLLASDKRVETLGIGESTFSRTGAESGYALALRQEGLKRLRRTTQALFLQSDKEYVRKAVALMRIFANGSPDGAPKDYKIDYDQSDAAPAVAGKVAPTGSPSAPGATPVDQPATAAADSEESQPDAVASRPGFAPVVQAARKVRDPSEGPPIVGFADVQGLRIDLEFKAGDTRDGKYPVYFDYGEIRGTKGVDGDKLDVYIGPNHDASGVVVIHQHDPATGEYDEDKVMLGFDDTASAVSAYQKQYTQPGFYVDGDYQELSFGQFWRMVKDKKYKGKKLVPNITGLPAKVENE